MKKKARFFKIFSASFFTTLIVIYCIIYIFLNRMSVKSWDGIGFFSSDIPSVGGRTNTLVIGVAGGLSDTLMFVSYDAKDKTADIMSIPRDTYFQREGYNHPAQKKINAAYGKDGAVGSVKAVSDLLGTPIHFYVEFDYDAVITIVDAIGGLEVQVPQNMNYDDPVDNLHIHFEKGQVVKDGEDIVKLLRWRKNNKGGGYKDGDIGRIQMQQHIVKLGIEKLLKGNIVSNFIKLQEPIAEYIKTDLSPNQMMSFVNKLKGLETENISFHTMPGSSKTMGLSYFIADEDKLYELIKEIQSKGKE